MFVRAVVPLSCLFAERHLGRLASTRARFVSRRLQTGLRGVLVTGSQRDEIAGDELDPAAERSKGTSVHHILRVNMGDSSQQEAASSTIVERAEEALVRMTESERSPAETNRNESAVMAISFYRRPLPPDCIALDSTQGRQLFERSLLAGRAEPFLPLVSQFTTQSEPAFCGLGSLAMVLNALQVDPGRPWKGPWRWFSEELLDCCLPLHIVAREGITLDEFRCLGQCNGALVETVQPPAPGVPKSQELSPERFREIVLRMCSDTDPRQGSGFLVLCYSREALQQTGSGHFSPIAAYDEETDRALVLDVARFKYAPHWVHLNALYRAMCAIDPATGSPRGLAVVRRHKRSERPAEALAPLHDPIETMGRPCAWRPRLLLLKRLSTQQETADALDAARTEIRNHLQTGAVAANSELTTASMTHLIRIWTQHLSRHLAVTPLSVRDANTNCECSSSRRLLLDALERSPLLAAYRTLNGGTETTTVADRALCSAAEALTMVGMLEYASRAPLAASPDPLQQLLQSQIQQLLGGSGPAYDEAKRIADVFAGFVNAAQRPTI